MERGRKGHRQDDLRSLSKEPEPRSGSRCTATPQTNHGRDGGVGCRDCTGIGEHQGAAVRNGWKRTTLKEVCVVDKCQGIHEAALPYVGLEQSNRIQGRFFGSSDPVEVKSSTFKFSSKHLLHGRLRPYLNKVMAPDFEGHCSTEIFPIKPMPGLSHDFLHYWFLRDATVAAIDATCTGHTNASAIWMQVSASKFALPPLPEQHRIIGILEKSLEVSSPPPPMPKRTSKTPTPSSKATFDPSSVGPPAGGWKRPSDRASGLATIAARRPRRQRVDCDSYRKELKMGYLQEFPKEFVAPKCYDSWMTRGIPRQGDVLLRPKLHSRTSHNLTQTKRWSLRNASSSCSRTRHSLTAPSSNTSYFRVLSSNAFKQKAREQRRKGFKASLLKTVDISFPRAIAEQKTDRWQARLSK